ncbi:MAG: hypothetical protein AAF755_11635 [Pseudomonadota bacterium]
MPDPIDAFIAEQRLYELVERHPAFKGFRVEKILKTGPDQLTARAKFQGKRVVIKRSLLSESERRVLEAKQELDILAKVMSAPPYRVNECVAAFPDLGLIVLSFVPGIRLDKAIKQASHQERHDLMKLSGGWLRTYTLGRVERGHHFSPGWWIKKTAGHRKENLSENDLSLFNRVLAHLRRLAPDLRGQSLAKAAIHADFVSINAHFADGCLYGYDIQGRAHLPIAQDVARFLVWTQVQTPALDDQTGFIHGISRSDVEAFLSSGVLPAEEYETILPFFIGLHVLRTIGSLRQNSQALEEVTQLAHRFIKGC